MTKPEPMVLQTIILWMHALAGAAWVAACLCFVIAGLALASGSEEQRNFALRAAPKIVGFNLMAAILVLLSGGVNLVFAGLARNFNFSSDFARILALKLALFVLMFLALLYTLRASRALPDDARPDAPLDALDDRVAVMVRMHAAIAFMGAIALLLGLWLMGT